MLLITVLITLLYPITSLRYGKNAKVGEFKFEVAITDKGKYVCGGVILDLTYVLTAAHCIIFEHLKDLQVIAGEVNGDLFHQEIKNQVKEIRYHPRYKKDTRDFDLVILILKEVVVSKHLVEAIPIINSDYTIQWRENAKLVSWDHFHGVRLASIDLEILSPDKCTALNVYGKYDFNEPTVPLPSENSVCTELLEDLCIYDDGGALVADGKLLGIMSWNVDCNRSEFPMFFSNMIKLGSWFKRVKRDL